MQVKTQEYIDFIPKFLKKLENDGMSKNVIGTAEWITNHFKKYCLNNNIENVDMEVIKQFYEIQYDFDINNIRCDYQIALRRPLLIFMEYYKSGNYFKTHQKSVMISVPEEYSTIYCLIQNEFINKLDITIKTKKRKLWIIANLINYLYEQNIKEIKNITISNVSNHIETISNNYANGTVRIIKSTLREVLNWLYQEGVINFSGKQAFPLIRKDTRHKLLSTYSEEEIKKILEVIDTTNAHGKCIFLVISLLAYYGLRVGDIINLKYDNFDFENNSIKIIQQKTKKELVLPLIDEVKFPLLDYLKNGRPKSADSEYILSTMHAPYTKFNNTSSIHRMVTRAMTVAGVNFENKQHGPHALRHSLATNMINNNVPISAISNVLGHSSTRTTDIYITKDTTHLRKLTLEVPYEIK